MFFKRAQTNMETEIFEQPEVISKILSNYFDFETKKININLPEQVSKLVFIASGSSYHCARFAVDLIEKYAKVEARAIYSSEFLLKNIIPTDNNTLYVFITQSGETSDTVKSLQRVKNETNLPTLCITNKEDSTIWNLADYKLSCLAGEEVGIAATKSFISQILSVLIITIKLLEINSLDLEAEMLKTSLFGIQEVAKRAINMRFQIKKIAKKLARYKNIILTAEGISYSLAKEGALKIKETSYKNVSAFILGEFMHGHVAILNNKSTLIFIANNEISERSINNLKKIKQDYNPNIVMIGNFCDEINPDSQIYIESKDEIHQLFGNIIILQLIALEIALKLKRNVDNPKGLHKVVLEKNL